MPTPKQEINIVSIAISLLKYKELLFKKWKIVLIISLLSGLGGILVAWLDPKIYTAKIIFALEEKSSSSMYSSIASQFGVDLGKGDAGMFKGDNIVELFKSRSMIEKTLFSTANFDGKQQLLIDRYFKGNEKESDDTSIPFDFNKNNTTLNRAEDSLLQLITDDILKNKLEWEKGERNAAFITFISKSTDELFAKEFLEKLTNEVSQFYFDTKTKKLKANIELLQYRVDSVKNALDEEMNAAANSQDQNLNAAVAKVKIPLLKRQMNIQLLTTLYGELTKNLELSKLSLVREEPLIQIIDSPKLPLKYKKKGRMLTGILYGIIGGVLAMLYLIGSDILIDLKKAVKEEKSKYE
jgi:uncharacterized protein involved in exopolysaccharide biosynthesis